MNKKEKRICILLKEIDYYSKVYSPKCNKVIEYKKKLEKIINS